MGLELRDASYHPSRASFRGCRSAIYPGGRKNSPWLPLPHKATFSHRRGDSDGFILPLIMTKLGKIVFTLVVLLLAGFAVMRMLGKKETHGPITHSSETHSNANDAEAADSAVSS